MKITVSRTKAEWDEKELRQQSRDAMSFLIFLKSKKQEPPICLELAVAALNYEHEVCKKSKRRSKFLQWFFIEFLKQSKEEMEKTMYGKQ